MQVICNNNFGIQEISLPYFNLEQAVRNIKLEGVEKEKLKISCEKIENTAKIFLIYLVNELQANMGIFRTSEYVGEYNHNGIKKKVYIKET